MLLETLIRLGYFGISHKPQTSRSHVNSALLSGLQLRFAFVQLDHAAEVSDLP